MRKNISSGDGDIHTTAGLHSNAAALFARDSISLGDLRIGVTDYKPHIMQNLVDPIVIGTFSLPFTNEAGDVVSKNMEIVVTPTQDFIDPTIIENIRAAGSVDLLNLSFRIKNQERGQKIATSAIFTEIKRHKNIEKALVDYYCDTITKVVTRANAQKPLLKKRREVSTEIYNTIADTIAPPTDQTEFIPESYKLLSDELVASIFASTGEINSPLHTQLYNKLKPIGNAMGGFAGARRAKLFVDHLDDQQKEIEEMLITPLKNNQKVIPIDTKFLYLDNGHRLYDDVLRRSYYSDYYKQDEQLLYTSRSTLSPYIRNQYISLGCGNGDKDFALLGAMDKSPACILLLEGSLDSLHEAEEVFNLRRAELFKKPGLLHGGTVLFSQDRIDKLAQPDGEGKLEMLQSTFGSNNTRSWTLPDFQHIDNTYAILGNTFGNFSPAYKVQFLKEVASVMNKGDTLLVTVFNKPKTKEEIADILDHYNTEEVHAFMKNFFMKLGVPEDAIEVKITYEDDVVHIDAMIHQKDPNHPVTMRVNGQTVVVPDQTLFTGFTSERVDRQQMEQFRKESDTTLKLVKEVTIPGNPSTIYVFKK